MDDCCEIREVPREQRRVLHIVLWINVAMFLVESIAGILGHSTALFADSIDMLGDAIVYGFSLYVISRGLRWQARAALLKGVIMAAFGIGVLVQVAVKIARGLTPVVEVMGIVGLLAFAFLYGGLFRAAAAGIRAQAQRGGIAAGLRLGVSAALIGFLMAGFFEWNFGDEELLDLLYTLVGLAWAAAAWPADEREAARG